MKLKTKRICWQITKIVVYVALVVGMFCFSVSAGLSAMLFSILGYTVGYFNRSHKLEKEFMDKLLDNKENILAGKLVTITADDATDEISIAVTEMPKKRQRKNKQD